MTHSAENFFEPNESESHMSTRQVPDQSTKTEISVEQRQLTELQDLGFHWEESVRLLYLRTHLHENAEMRQRLMADYRMHFARWLYEHGTVNEES